MWTENAELEHCPNCNEPVTLEDGTTASFCLQCRFPIMCIASKYRLERILATGGSGTLYLAHHKHLMDASERVVKVLQTKEENKQMTSRFYREVQLTARASQVNQHIIRIYDDFGYEPFLGYYYVMEYLEGENLGERLKKQSVFDLRETLEIFSQLCEAMTAAHEIGVIHRDLKPENILLLRKGYTENFVKVIDFGIARQMDRKPLTHPSQGLLGTPLYMSPEQCLNRKLDTRSDIYAMGILLYEMLSGKTPFDVTGESIESSILTIIFNHLNTTPTPLLERTPAPTIPAALDHIILQALEKEPADRFESVKEFWDAIEKATQDFNPDDESEGYIPTSTGPIESIAAGWGHSPFTPPEEISAEEEDSSIDEFTVNDLPIAWSDGADEDDYTQPLLYSQIDEDEFDDRTQPFLRTRPEDVRDTDINALIDEKPSVHNSKPHEQALIVSAEHWLKELQSSAQSQLLQQLSEHAEDLWNIIERYAHHEPATALRALLVLHPLIKSQGDRHYFSTWLCTILEHPSMLLPELHIKALLALSECYQHTGHMEESLSVLHDALYQTDRVQDGTYKANILNRLGRIYQMQGQLSQSHQKHQSALLHFQHCQDRTGEAETRSYLGNIARLAGRMEDAKQEHQTALGLFQSLRDRSGEGKALSQLGHLYRTMGEYAEAEDVYTAALHIQQEQGDHRNEAIIRSNLGHTLALQGKLDSARLEYEYALHLFRHLQDRRGEAITLGHLGDLYRREGNYEEGKRVQHEALQIHREQKDLYGEAIRLNQLGTLHRTQGFYSESKQYHHAALHIQTQLDDQRGMGMTQFNQGLVCLEQNQLAEAEQWFSLAMQLLRTDSQNPYYCELLLYRGILYQQAGSATSALRSIQQARVEAEKLHSPLLNGRILSFLAILEIHTGQIETGCSELEKALHLFTQTSYQQGHQLHTIAIGHLHAQRIKTMPSSDKEFLRIHKQKLLRILNETEHLPDTDVRLALQLLRQAAKGIVG